MGLTDSAPAGRRAANDAIRLDQTEMGAVGHIEPYDSTAPRSGPNLKLKGVQRFSRRLKGRFRVARPGSVQGKRQPPSLGLCDRW
jgi:hypothetical protein